MPGELWPRSAAATATPESLQLTFSLQVAKAFGVTLVPLQGREADRMTRLGVLVDARVDAVIAAVMDGAMDGAGSLRLDREGDRASPKTTRLQALVSESQTEVVAMKRALAGEKDYGKRIDMEVQLSVCNAKLAEGARRLGASVTDDAENGSPGDAPRPGTMTAVQARILASRLSVLTPPATTGTTRTSEPPGPSGGTGGGTTTTPPPATPFSGGAADPDIGAFSFIRDFGTRTPPGRGTPGGGSPPTSSSSGGRARQGDGAAGSFTSFTVILTDAAQHRANGDASSLAPALGARRGYAGVDPVKAAAFELQHQKDAAAADAVIQKFHHRYRKLMCALGLGDDDPTTALGRAPLGLLVSFKAAIEGADDLIALLRGVLLDGGSHGNERARILLGQTAPDNIDACFAAAVDDSDDDLFALGPAGRTYHLPNVAALLLHLTAQCFAPTEDGLQKLKVTLNSLQFFVAGSEKVGSFDQLEDLTALPRRGLGTKEY